MVAPSVPDNPELRQGEGHGVRPAARRSVRRNQGFRRGASRLIPDELHEWDEYGIAVLTGKITTGRLAYLAVRRHYEDLKKAEKRGLHFSPAHARHVIDFFPKFCMHVEGPMTGRPFELAAWQKFWTAVLFGWRRADGSRRFRTGYIEVARKNGKSTWMAGLGLYMTRFDREGGANVHSAATKADQAKEVYEPAAQMVRRSKLLSRVLRVYKGFIKSTDGSCLFSPLSSDANTMDGLNPSMAIVDELHAHKTRDLWNVLKSALGARRHPMMLAITTAGFIPYGICTDQRGYLQSILEGTVEDDTYFGVIYTLDVSDTGEGDDWRDEKVWIKANPGLGISKSLDYMRAEAKAAREITSQQNNFKTKELNIWCQQAERWIDIDLWDAGKTPVDLTMLEGRTCYGGLDLATTTDLAAFVLVFPPDDEEGQWIVLPRFWVPKENMERREKKDKVPYPTWAKQGLIEATEGNIIDYSVIRKRINEDAERFDIVEIGFDRWNATQLTTQLREEDGLNMVALAQGFATMSAPSKELEVLVTARRLVHGGHKVLRWCAGNVTLRRDPNGNYMPDKAKSTERIDGIAALIMAIQRAGATIHDDTEPGIVIL